MQNWLDKSYSVCIRLAAISRTQCNEVQSGRRPHVVMHALDLETMVDSCAAAKIDSSTSKGDSSVFVLERSMTLGKA